MRKVYFFAAALVATLTGCDNSEMNNITDSKQVAVEVTAGIEGVTTRMKNTTWQSGDEIGVFGTSGKMSYSNYRYKWTSGNAFKPYSNVIYYGDEEGQFTAYYPYAAAKDITDNKITRKLLEQYSTYLDDQIDFLYAEATGTKDDPQVDFQFKHKMSKVVLKLVPGNGYNSASGFASWWNIVFSNLHSQVSFNIKTGEVEPIGSAEELNFAYSAVWGFSGNYVAADNATYYTFIVCPGERVDGGMKVDLVYNNKYDGYTLHTTLFTGSQVFETEAGKEYTYTVTVNKTDLKVENAIISPWDPVTLPNDGKVDTTL